MTLKHSPTTTVALLECIACGNPLNHVVIGNNHIPTPEETTDALQALRQLESLGLYTPPDNVRAARALAMLELVGINKTTTLTDNQKQAVIQWNASLRGYCEKHAGAFFRVIKNNHTLCPDEGIIREAHGDDYMKNRVRFKGGDIIAPLYGKQIFGENGDHIGVQLIQLPSKGSTDRTEKLIHPPADGWQRFENHADRPITDLMTGQVDELSVIKEAHGWRGEYNICGAADAIDIDEVDGAKTMEQAIAAADLWLRGYTGGES